MNNFNTTRHFNKPYVNDSEINKHIIFGLIFLGLLIFSSYTFLKYLIPIGIVGIIIPLIGFIFHFDNAFKNGFELNILSMKINNIYSFLEYIFFNLLFSFMFALLFAFIMYYFS